MNEYEKFTELILEKVLTWIEGLDQVELQERMEDSFWGVGKKPKPPQLTKEEEFYLEIFRHLREIIKSLENLDYILAFIKKPFRKSKAYKEAGITRNVYLRYHVEHYLQENYILLKHVDTFLGWLYHEFKNEGRIKDSQRVSRLRGVFQNGTKNLSLVLVRGDHVHKTRFNDDDLSKLSVFELLSTHSQDEDSERVTTLAYKIAKEEWCERIIKNNKFLKELLDVISGKLLPIVFPSEAQNTK